MIARGAGWRRGPLWLLPTLLAPAIVAALVLARAGGDGDAGSTARPPDASPARALATPPAAPTATAGVDSATPAVTTAAAPAAASTRTATPEPAPTPEPTPVATALRYDTYDSTGAVAAPGSYAFLTDTGGGNGRSPAVVTTYEGAREDATVLRVHLRDARGVSRAAVYDAVEAGDIFEWYRADDCFTRYQVTSAPAAAPGAAYREFGVAWMTYAFTGCRGALDAATADLDFGELPDLGGRDLAAPVLHSIYQLVPLNWEGEVKPRLHRRLPEGAISSQFFAQNPTSQVARQLPYWRDPDLPDGWSLVSVSSGYETDPPFGYTAIYAPPGAPLGLELTGYFPTTPGATVRSATVVPGGVRETRVVDGRPAIVGYSPPGEGHDSAYASTVWIHDPATDSAYRLKAYAGAVRQVDVLIEIARSLFTGSGDEDAPATALRYDTYDSTGAVTAPGSYAFLAGTGDGNGRSRAVITTYQGIREDATTLRMHVRDADGVARAGVYDAVEAGDIFEWHRADDCFTRYRVTSAPAPAPGAAYRELGVEWMTYAFTGCRGALDAAAADLDFGDLPDLGGTSLTSPVVHGAYQLVPEGWTGAVEEHESRSHVPTDYPAYGGPSWVDNPTLAQAEALPHWCTPTLPTGWTLGRISYGTVNDSPNCYTAVYLTAERSSALNVRGCYVRTRHWPIASSGSLAEPTRYVIETRTIAGRPAIVKYTPRGPHHSSTYRATVIVLDPATNIQYAVEGRAPGLKGANIDPVIAIAASLFGSEQDNDRLPPTALRYGTYDTMGAVTTPGSYAFLAETGGGDGRSPAVVTTYEGIREDATMLRVHLRDADGVSRAAVYDAVEAGDLFEWHRADDCFTRYAVTSTPEPHTGYREFGVEPIAYAFTGCSGTITTSASVSANWGALPNLGGTSLAAPIVQGPFQLVPAGWTGATKPVGPRVPDRPTVPSATTTSLAEARTFPHWREPDLPEGWTFTYAVSGDEEGAGYFEAFYDGLTLTVSASGINAKYGPKEATATYDNGTQTSVRETLQIAGRPARVHRSITEREFSTTVHVWDEATGVLYALQWRGHATELIALAESMFEGQVPAVEIAAVSTTVGEGRPAQFTVSRMGGTAAALTVAVSVSETGDTLAGTTPASVTIPAGASHAALDVETDDDEVRETDSVVTATLTAPAGYVAGPSGSATVTVEDDDPLPATTLRYDTYDLAGGVTRPGSYAFLSGAHGTTAVTTYEGLRDGSAARLLVHTTDAGGASRAAFYDTVRPGDLLEWRQAGDCWTGYRVVDVKADPAGTVPRKLLGVERYGYAYTGCEGAIRATAAVEKVWDDPPARGGASLTAPTVYGAFQVVPQGWSHDVDGAIWLGVERDPPAYSGDNYVSTKDIAVARTLAYWRDLSLPGWALGRATSGGPTDPVYGYCSEWGKSDVGWVEVCGAYSSFSFGPRPARKASGRVNELRLVNGHAAVVDHLPPGNPNSWVGSGIWVYVYDEAAGAQYHVRSLSVSLGGGNPDDVEAMLVIVRALFPE